MKDDAESDLPVVSLAMPARESLSSRSATALKRYLLAERLEPGDKLPPERRLAEALNVSRTVLREAVNQLVGEGLVRREPSRSPTVTDFDRRQLAAQLLEEPEMLAFGSVGQVAGQLAVEPEEVQRFARDLGYSGYQTLQASVREAYLRNAGLDPAVVRPAGGEADELLAEQRRRQRADLEKLYEAVGRAQLDEMCAALEGARRVVVYGEGASAALAGVLARMLQHVGVNAQVMANGPVDSALDMYGLGPQDVVLCIALWLPFRGSIDVMRLASDAGCHTVAFTASPGSPITRYSKQVAIVPAQGTALSFTVLPTVALFENLTAVLAGRRPELAADIQQSLHNRYVKEGLVAHMRDLRG
ncbi:RpiR family transcriptional regulator [Catellatospora methionotrophica]|uniref:RpiR family transcriptional regulator n=1 Tax=Catellatospora methionotrophica TaxID=121620 RepID=A0A8J3KZU3_9ACTN|nr:GntR family transcriptional regulator [Catellatospora methionotrophica]GIG11997.1 RpiR family transcriptional regulator [Catellatospora methionotrophica]